MYFIISIIALLVVIALYTSGLSITTLSLLSLVLGTIGVVTVITISQSLIKDLNAITKGADLIRKGSFQSKVQVHSRDEIGTLAMAFNDMTNTLEQKIAELKLTEDNLIKERERAEHFEKAKKHFLVNMSHEIRTPMNAILGFARYLQESLTGKDEQESIRMIVKSGEHLLATLNDILDFSNIETGAVSFMRLPFNLRDTIATIYQLMESNAKLKKIGLSYSIDNSIPDSIIYGDSVRLTQILLSLTSNALKFTEFGHVSIAAKAVSNDEDDQIAIEFSVKDTGIGIPLEKQEKIFELFEQGTNHMTRKFGGTGIGLSIVKHLITLQQGEIYVRSILNEGSEFCFKLSFFKTNICDDDWDEHHKNELALKPDLESRKRIKVLIVEDNAINQLLVIKLLQKHGYETTVAENGKVALRKYTTADFDIILMDLQMPEMDGYETTIHIRDLKSYKKDVPIVAMTAHTIKGEMEKCLSIGMNDYISKPFHANELYEKITGLVKQVTPTLVQ
ncbi:MAG: response regulator [Candidatus Pedobacter colombiensis]|uniref:histidine kinase n=1 Tax=Candidatus Pedobacter colombiensis TaxID=3121371 RepID=A0AAJ5WCC7_9SPHI|nr:response regulator [Pedobacter sp.]WEK20112.1 MAG: response regulator [Pedobacter sp.]